MATVKNIIALFPAEYRSALLACRGKSFEIGGLDVVDTFATSGSSGSTSGSKIVSAIRIGEQLLTVGANVPLAGNSRDVVYGVALDEVRAKQIDCFYASELYLLVAQRNPSRAKAAFAMNLDETKATLFLTVTTGRGVKAELTASLSARGTMELARALALGVGYQLPKSEEDALVALCDQVDAEAASTKKK